MTCLASRFKSPIIGEQDIFAEPVRDMELVLMLSVISKVFPLI